MANLSKVVVSVDDNGDEPRTLSDIAAELTDAGLEVDDILESLAVITGTCDASAIRSLEDIPGVLDVEPQRAVRAMAPDERD